MFFFNTNFHTLQFNHHIADPGFRPRTPVATKHVEAPINRPIAPSGDLPPGQNICTDCERLIV